MIDIVETISSLEKTIQTCNKSAYSEITVKLRRKLNAELKFLSSLDPDDENSIHSAQSSNVTHLLGIFSVFFNNCTPCCGILRSFCYECENGKASVVVDVMLPPNEKNNGFTWIKVIARNPRSVQHNFHGNSSFGEKNIAHHAKEFVTCASQNLHHFVVPSVVFIFVSGVTLDVKEHLESVYGITVRGKVISDDGEKLNSHKTADDICTKCLPNNVSTSVSCTSVNLDVTTLVVLCSNLCRGRHYFDFQDATLNRMARDEAASPALRIVTAFIEGKQLLVSHSAMNQFLEIVSKVAGPCEQERAKFWRESVSLVPDAPSDRVHGLRRSSRIRDFNCVVFGTADNLRIVTLSANTGFVRAAQNQGVELAVEFHPPRAFTEQKEPRNLT